MHPEILLPIDSRVSLFQGTHLLRDTPKNRYLPNGHNYQEERLPAYLPGNGGVLAAAALMAAGWDGADASRPAPGFPADWNVRIEGLQSSP